MHYIHHLICFLTIANKITDIGYGGELIGRLREGSEQRNWMIYYGAHNIMVF